MKNIQLFIIGIFTILLFALSANAATWTVTKSTNSDDNMCDADCSLREAVFNADTGDTVVFDSNLIGQTFTLSGSEIVITKRITIDGNTDGVNVAFISGSNTSRIFLIETGGGLDLRNATLVQGNGASNNFDNGNGGAIYAKEGTSLSLDRTAVRGNSANFYGAIFRVVTEHITLRIRQSPEILQKVVTQSESRLYLAQSETFIWLMLLSAATSTPAAAQTATRFAITQPMS